MLFSFLNIMVERFVSTSQQIEVFFLQVSFWNNDWIFFFFFIGANHIYYLCLLEAHFAIKDFKVFSPSSGGITKHETNKEDV